MNSLLSTYLKAGLLGGLLLPIWTGQTATAQARNIRIDNASFEQPAIPAGTFLTNGAPPGWSPFGSLNFSIRTIGVLDPATTTLYVQPAPDGENVGVVFLMDDPLNQTFFANIEAGMQQTLQARLRANTRYKLTVEVGNITDDPNPPHHQWQFLDFPGYRIELMSGGQVLASDTNGVLPVEGGFETSTTIFTTGDTHPRLGQQLGIRLVNLNAAPGLEVNFDCVRLEALKVRRIAPQQEEDRRWEGPGPRPSTLGFLRD